MQVEVLNLNGVSAGSVILEEKVFGIKVSEGSIYHKIRNELANARQGTVKTKQRGEVSYSGRKPWRQKGTGRARAGTRRSPIWVGGGTIFGPTPRDYSYSLPKKIKRLAFRSVLTQKINDGVLKVVDDVQSSDGKTKDFVSLIRGVVPKEMHNVVLITHEHNPLIKRAARNIPWLKLFVYSQLILKDLFYAQKILVTKNAIEQLNVFLNDRGEKDVS